MDGTDSVMFYATLHADGTRRIETSRNGGAPSRLEIVPSGVGFQLLATRMDGLDAAI